MKLCAHLRWKGFYGRRWSSRERLVADLCRDEVPYTCLRTCQPFGPDDDVCAPELCQPERGCFELSARDPQAREVARKG